MAKTLDDAPAAAYEVVRQRGLAASIAAREFIKQIYGEHAREIIRALPKPDLQQVVCELMMSGVSMVQCADLIGIGKGTISKWFSSETFEMQKLMKTALTRDALIEMPVTWGTIKAKRYSENEETARKAALDCMRAAGMAIDAGLQGSAAISIHAQNLQFNNLSIADLDRKILELAWKLGPDAVKLAEIEVKGNVKREAAGPGVAAQSGVLPAGPPAAGGIPGALGGPEAP